MGRYAARMAYQPNSVVETGKRDAYRYRGDDGYLTVIDRSEGSAPSWSWRVKSPGGAVVAEGCETKFRLAKLVGNTVARAIAKAVG